MVRDYKKKRRLEDWRRWEDLEMDLLAVIFSKMEDKELISTMSCVCNSWRWVCWDMLFYKKEGTLDLDALKYVQQEIGEDYNSTAMRLMRVLKSISFDEDKLGCVTTMVFNQCTFLFDRHLLFLAERSPKLKVLCLPCAKRITGRGFSRAIYIWKGIEEMSLGPLTFSNHYQLIKEIGINCKKLQVICFHRFNLDMVAGPVIIENFLRNIKEIRLQNISISRVGLQAILSKCKKLVKVGIKNCNSLERKHPFRQEVWEIRKIKVGSDIKWFIGTEEEFNLNGLLDFLWK